MHQASVIPAKAGIQSLDKASLKVDEVVSRFRGNDERLGRNTVPNDTPPAAALNCIHNPEMA